MTLASSLAAQEDRLMSCVHCGFCLPACPTYVRLGDEADSPRGRLYLMRAVAEGRLDAGSDAFQTHIDRCLGCRACEPVCPAGVEYGMLLERAREAATQGRPGAPLSRLMLWVFSRPRATAWSMALGRWFRATGIPAVGARLLPGRLARTRLGLAMLASTRRRRTRLASTGPSTRQPSTRQPSTGRQQPAVPPVPEAYVATPPRSTGLDPGAATHPMETGMPKRVVVLEGCVQAGLLGGVNDATCRVLQANGLEVVSATGQQCCGALHSHGGDLEGARTLARRNIDAFKKAEADAIVTNAAGCGAQIKDYRELLRDDPAYAERASQIAEIARDISEILAAAGPRPGAPLTLKVTYDAPCHLIHGQRVADQPLAVLRAIPGLEVVPLSGADECCGGAGIYGITHPELGGEIGRSKVSAVLETGAEVVATGNPGCMMQIGAGLRMAGSGVEALHPVELLDESYRSAGFYDPATQTPPSSSSSSSSSSSAT